jgi:peptidoglycan hydrolase CwlO-like protein
MRRVVILVMAVFMMSVSIPVIAAEMTKAQKDQCLLASKGCMGEVDTIQKKISKLDAEIKKGTKVYSPDEIKKLNAKLKETEDLLDKIISGNP